MHKPYNHTATKDTILFFIAILFFIMLPIEMANWQIKANLSTGPSKETINNIANIQIRKSDPAVQILASYGFDMGRIRKGDLGVPTVYFANMPQELTKVKDVNIRKRMFFASLLPAILKVNDIIRYDRKKLKTIILKMSLSKDISEAQYLWLSQKMLHYKIPAIDIDSFLTRKDKIFNELLTRVNIIPPELALAQAAQESGWGTSRFAQQGNALFGQWTWGGGCTMTPKERANDKKHQIKCFNSIIESVDSYMLNLNTNKAYQVFRDQRQNFPDDKKINTMALVDTLINYSEEGPQYTEKIKNIIRVNKLYDFKYAKLANK